MPGLCSSDVSAVNDIPISQPGAFVCSAHTRGSAENMGKCRGCLGSDGSMLHNCRTAACNYAISAAQQAYGMVAPCRTVGSPVTTSRVSLCPSCRPDPAFTPISRSRLRRAVSCELYESTPYRHTTGYQATTIRSRARTIQRTALPRATETAQSRALRSNTLRPIATSCV